MANTIKLGNGNWATKEGSLLAYNDENNNFKPLPFTTTRASSASVVNKQGLIETVGSGIPRIDFSDDANGALLLEPSRTNILLNSDNGSSYGVFSATKTLDEVISLDGTLNSFTLEGNGDSNQILGYSDNKTLIAGDYTFSVFAKKGTNDFIQLFFDGFSGSSNGDAYFDLENGTTSSSFGKIENYGNGWYRCSIVGTVVSGDLYGRFGLRCSYTSSNFFYPTANDAIGKNAYFYGFQAEQGSYATSYIPTQGTAQTRVADTASKTGLSSLIGQTEGTMFVDYNQKRINQNTTRRIITLTDGSPNNRIVLYITSINKIEYYIRNSSGDLFTGQSSLAYGNSVGNHKIAAAYKDGDYVVYMDGNLIISGVGTSGTIPACNRVDIGSQLGGNDLFEPIKSVQVYTTALSDAELTSLTTI